MDSVLERVRAHRVLLAALGLLLVLYGAAGFVVLPRVLRTQVTAYVSQTLHRQLRIADIQFNPFTFTLELKNLSLNEADGAPLLSFTALRVNAELSSIIHRAIVLKEVTLDQPRVRAVLAANGELNLQALVPPESPATASPAASAPEPAAASEPIALRIGLLSVRAGRVEFEDHALDRPVSATLTPIDFTLQDFRTQAGHENAYHFDARTLAGEGLAWDGQFTVRPLGSSGNIKISALKANTIAAWLQDALPFALPSGTLDLSSHYQMTYVSALGLKLQVPTLSLTAFSIAPRSDVSQTWLQFPSILLSDIDVGLSERSVRVGNIDVDNAKVQVQRRADGTLNLNELFTPVAVTPAPAASATPTVTVTSNAPVTSTTAALPAANLAWSIALGELSLKDAAVEFTDQTLQPAAQYLLQPVSVQIKDYSSAPAHALGVLADVGLGKGALHAEGQAVPSPMSVDLKLSATALDLSQLQPYLTQRSDLQLNSGRFTGAFQVQYADQPARRQPRMRVRGDLQVEDIASKDALQHQDFVSWKQLKVAGIDFQQEPDRWSIEQVTLRDPYARVRIAANGVINISEVLRPARLYPPPPPPTLAEKAATDKQASAAGPATVATAAPPTPVTPARLRAITIVNGTVSFTDNSLTPQFSTNIYNLAGSVKGLSSVTESRATVTLAGSVDRYAPVTIGGEVNLLAASSYTDLSLKFANMDLTTFNPYSGKFAGYNITRGKLTTQLHYKIQNRQLAAEHHVILDQLEFGAATESKDAVPLPVKLAVALLKDRNGVIDINLPVGGTLDDPDFRIGPIIWKAVRGLLLKIVTAPFALLGSLFGGGDELSYVDFAPGRFEIVPDQAAKLAKLASALMERPQLKLDVPLAAVSAADDAALSRAKLDAALPELPTKGKTAPPAAQDEAGQRRLRLAKLGALYTTQLGAAPAWTPELTPADPKAALTDELVKGRTAWLEAALLPRYAPAAEDRDALGRARAESVRAALVDVSKIDPERVFLSIEPTTPKEPEGAVRMELKLQ